MKMTELSTSLSGITVNILEHDTANARRSYERFAAQYREVSGLVPEWKSRFPMAPVGQLGSTLRSGNQEAITASMGKLGQVCGSCHAQNMVPVQQKFHWRDFETINVKDPLSGNALGFREFKHMMAGNFSGIAVDLQEGQRENALKQYEGFKLRFDTFRETCGECHDTERRYYVDAEVQSMIDSLGALLQTPAPKEGSVETLARGIGQESCFKCHLVHLPAAMARVRH
jgi:hypothetical protein